MLQTEWTDVSVYFVVTFKNIQVCTNTVTCLMHEITWFETRETSSRMKCTFQQNEAKMEMELNGNSAEKGNLISPRLEMWIGNTCRRGPINEPPPDLNQNAGSHRSSVSSRWRKGQSSVKSATNPKWHRMMSRTLPTEQLQPGLVRPQSSSELHFMVPRVSTTMSDSPQHPHLPIKSIECFLANFSPSFLSTSRSSWGQKHTSARHFLWLSARGTHTNTHDYDV